METGDGREKIWDCFCFRRALGARLADVAQLVERVLGKDEVSGSIPLVGSSDLKVFGVLCQVSGDLTGGA